MEEHPSRLHALELVPVLELIGVALDDGNEISTLKACSLVSHEWHRVFAPFLWWRVVDDFDKVLSRLYKTRFAPALGLAASEPDAQIEPEFLALIDDFVKKVEDPSIPSAIHRQRRTYLTSPSYISFVILAGLCEKTRVIDYVFHSPPQFEIYDASVGRLVAPENCRMSNDYWISQQRADGIATVLENSPLLEDLRLNNSTLSHDLVAQQWLQLGLPSSDASTDNEPLSPRWPKLRSAVFESATVDHHYLEIFLLNSPQLQRLHLRGVRFLTKRSNIVSRPVFPDPTLIKARDQDSHLSDESINTWVGLKELTMSALLGISPEKQLHFALRLPSLQKFSFRLDPELDNVRLFYKPGFSNLTSMSISGNFDHEVLVRAARRLVYLKLEDSSLVDDNLFETIARHRDTLESLVIHSRVLTVDIEEGPHWIFRTCHRLLILAINLPVLNCNPAKFRGEFWACTRLRTLAIIPDCVPKNSTYTAFQAQKAFFQHVALTCSELRRLSFCGGTGSNDFLPHEGLALLTPLKKLEGLNLRSKSLETNAQLTVEHAKLVVSEWPRLKSIEGLYHYASQEFMSYVQEHRPEVDFSHF
ncbi:hypothetical protein EC991_001727 [Linnemannia zychae]|nr:hypothetical protein EC991_001727 [Linnemannia zychae]